MPPNMWATDNGQQRDGLIEQGLPANILAERMVLGAVLLEGERFGLVRDILTFDDFAIEKHRKIWRRLAEMYEAGTHIDRVTLYEALDKLGEVESVDGLSYLVSLDEGLPHLFDLESYAKIVQEKAIRRRMIYTAQQVINLATSGDDLTAITDQMRGMFAGLTPATTHEFATPGEVVVAAGGLDTYLATFRRRGIQWPWTRLNDFTGGMFPGELSIIAAGTGRGKTDFCLNTSLYCAVHGAATVIISLEMSREQVVNRFAALSGGFNRSCIRHEPMSWQFAGMQAGFGAVADLPIFVRDSSSCTVAAIEAGVRRLQAKHDIRLVAVDYLQLVTGRGNTRQEEVGSVARGLKVMASALKVHILAACQFSREHQKTGAKPRLHDLRESGDIEQAANNVLFLHGETTYQSQPAEELALDLIVGKQRDGAGNLVIPLTFRGDTGRFTEAT